MGRTAATSLTALLLLWLSACAGSSAIDSPDAGRTAAYEPGIPNFDMESVVRMEGDRPAIEVHYSFPYASLVFVQAEERYTAEYELLVRLMHRGDESFETERTETDRLTTAAYDSTVGFHPHSGRILLHAPAGEYVVEAVMTDVQTGETARRRQSVHLAAPDSGETFVSRILLEGKGDADMFAPIVSLHMPALMDSLRAVIELYNLRDDQALDLLMSLERLESDSSTAAPPYWFDPMRGSLAYRGINDGDVDTIQVTRRVVRDVSESASVQFSLPRLDPGIYRLRIAGRDPAGSVAVDRERLLSVKNPTFPRMSMLDDLVAALAYIAYDNEIDGIRQGGSPVEKKRRFDAFWGSLVSNRNAAANLIELYYGRIEEANLYFTGYKEGWMTDRGMVFTILGPPVYIERRIDREIWYYSYGDRDPVNTYVFERVRNRRDDPFETYILQRRPYYQTDWGRAVDRWRNGDVL